MLSYFLETDVGGLRTPDAVGGWRMWFGWVWRDLKPHLSAAGTRLIAGAIDILASLAGKKKSCSAAHLVLVTSKYSLNFIIIEKVIKIIFLFFMNRKWKSAK